jgi:hypothetical protein
LDEDAPAREGRPRVVTSEFEDVRAGGVEDEGVALGDVVGEDVADSTPLASVTGAGVGGYERGSMRTRATSKGTGAAFGSVASRSRPPVETVTLRAFVASPMRTTGSDLTLKAGGSTCGSVTVSGVGVGHASV